MKNIMPKIEYFKRLVVQLWLMILVASIIGGVLGGVISRITYKPEYEMTQAFTIEVALHPGANDASVNDTQLSKTIPVLLSSETFMEHMAPIIEKAGAKGKFMVTSLDNSNIFYITCIAQNNKSAQIIINEIQKHYTDIADYVIGESQMKFLAPPSYSKLPINTPHYTIMTLLGFVLGAFLVCAVFALLAIISNTVTDENTIESEINTKKLADIKRVYIKKRSDSSDDTNKHLLVSNEKADFDFKKSISTLSSNVHQLCSNNNYKSIFVTSTLAGEGKSTVALNLAIDLADKGNRVIIVDFDLRNPSIAEYLGIDDVFLTLSQGVKKHDYVRATSKTKIPNLYYCGNLKENEQGFDSVSDEEINTLMHHLKSSFDYIIIDTAPVGFLGDAISISSATDCFLYVVSYNYVNKPNIIRCISLLNETNKNMLGYVLNNR